MEKKRNISALYIVVVGLMTALVFISSRFFSITIPVSVAGQPTRIHFGNIFCLFSGFILGPVGGGLAAGLGSALYDFTDPIFISSMPFTFAFKFAMGFICGKIAYCRGHKGTNLKTNILAGSLGILAYIILYLSRNFIRDLTFFNLSKEIIILNLITRGSTSIVNGIIAVAIAVPLGFTIRKALEAANLMDKINPLANK